MHVCVCACVRACMSECMRVCVRVFVRARVRVCVHLACVSTQQECFVHIIIHLKYCLLAKQNTQERFFVLQT
jgi:hypothetical protein